MASLDDGKVDRTLMVRRRGYLLESLTFLSVPLCPFIADLVFFHAKNLR